MIDGLDREQLRQRRRRHDPRRAAHDPGASRDDHAGEVRRRDRRGDLAKRPSRRDTRHGAFRMPSGDAGAGAADEPRYRASARARPSCAVATASPNSAGASCRSSSVVGTRTRDLLRRHRDLAHLRLLRRAGRAFGRQPCLRAWRCRSCGCDRSNIGMTTRGARHRDDGRAGAHGLLLQARVHDAGVKLRPGHRSRRPRRRLRSRRLAFWI